MIYVDAIGNSRVGLYRKPSDAEQRRCNTRQHVGYSYSTPQHVGITIIRIMPRPVDTCDQRFVFVHRDVFLFGDSSSVAVIQTTAVGTSGFKA